MLALCMAKHSSQTRIVHLNLEFEKNNFEKDSFNAFLLHVELDAWVTSLSMSILPKYNAINCYSASCLPPDHQVALHQLPKNSFISTTRLGPSRNSPSLRF